MPHVFEVLEDRRLLSATVVDKVLTITGTDGADRVSVFEVGSKVVVQEASQTSTGTTRPQWETKRTVFNRADVESINADLKGGNDVFGIVSFSRSPLPAAVTGGGGRDFIRGGRGNDTLDGGDDGDFISGGGGNDGIRGGAGSDRLSGDGGDDTIEGGEGRDYLLGGRGADILRGGAGNDILVSIDGDDTDTVDGGDNDATGGDSALVDKGDTVTNVERIVTFPRTTPPTP